MGDETGGAARIFEHARRPSSCTDGFKRGKVGKYHVPCAHGLYISAADLQPGRLFISEACARVMRDGVSFLAELTGESDEWVIALMVRMLRVPGRRVEFWLRTGRPPMADFRRWADLVELLERTIPGGIGAMISRLQASRGWSDSDLAREVGVKRKKIRRWHWGGAIPYYRSMARLLRLAERTRKGDKILNSGG